MNTEFRNEICAILRGSHDLLLAVAEYNRLREDQSATNKYSALALTFRILEQAVFHAQIPAIETREAQNE